MGESIRLLVVDGSELLTWMVSRVAPPGVEVSRAKSFSEAEAILVDNPPHAAIFNLAPCIPVWQSLIEKCANSTPEIPFMCTAAMDKESAHRYGVPCRIGDFLSLDMTPTELARAVGFLIQEVRLHNPVNFDLGADRGSSGSSEIES